MRWSVCTGGKEFLGGHHFTKLKGMFDVHSLGFLDGFRMQVDVMDFLCRKFSFPFSMS